MNSLFIVMPAYNEERNIEKVVKQWYQVLEGKSEDSRLVVADGGSSDRTHDILLNLQANGYSQLTILSDTEKQHGPKVIALYKYAIENGVDYVFQTDSDGQTNPYEFEVFWNDREKFDGQFGNRTVRGDGKDRAFVEKVVCLLLRIYFGVKVPDANAPFRLMRCDILKKYVNRLPYDFNIPNIMYTTYFVKNNEKVDFKTISFKQRQAGENSIDIPKIIKLGWKALWDFRQLRKSI